MNGLQGVSYLTEHLLATSAFAQNFPPWLLGALCMGGAGVLVLTFVMVYGMVAVWTERKVAGHIQDRLGPMRVGWHGWLQSLADGVKLMMKEDIIPTLADKPLFLAAPGIVFLGALTGFAVIPFSERAQMSDLNIGVLYVAAMTSLVVVGIIMAGWASNSKWPLYGAMRSAALIVSYGIPLSLSIVPVLMVTGSLSMQDLVAAQTGGILKWNAFQFLPFLPCAFLIFFIAALAESNRVPFDIAEAESELVGGYHTEYSGILFSLFFIAEYASMFLSCAVAVTLFLGGYNAPALESLGLWGLPRLLAGALLLLGLYWRFKTFRERGQTSEAIFFVAFSFACLALWKCCPQIFWFLGKTSLLLLVMLWLRWTLPRLRIDQMMYMCWKVLTPLAFINVLGTGLWWVFWH